MTTTWLKRPAFAAALGLMILSTAVAQDVVMTRQLGTSGFDAVFDIVRGSDGSLYATGWTSGTFAGQTSAGGYDGFIRKMNPDGTEVWTRQFGTSSDDVANAIAIDGTRLYVVGTTLGVFPGQSGSGQFDAFVRRYDTSGNVVWTQQFGTPGRDVLEGVSVDGNGNVAVAGLTEAALPGQIHAGRQDAFASCFLPSGVAAWTRQFGTAQDDVAFDVTSDAVGNVTVGGQVLGVLPGQTGFGSADAYLRRFSPSGSEVWTRQFGTSEEDRVLGLGTDPMGNLLATGATRGPLPGQTHAGYDDAFVQRWSSAGALQWTRQIGSQGNDEMNSVVADQQGNVFVAGVTWWSLPGQTSSGLGDAFLMRFAPDGQLVWARQFGTEEDDYAFAIRTEPSGTIVVAGATLGTLPGQASAGQSDGFVMRWAQRSCLDTANPDGAERGPISGPVHSIEPMIPDPGIRDNVHELNCTVIDPLGL